MPRAGRRKEAPSEPAMIGALVEGHRAFVRFVEKRVGSRETAEDIVQDAFRRALGRAGALRRSESAVAWFYRMLRNAVVDHYRRRAASSRALEGFARELDRPGDDTETRADACKCIAGLAATLKPEYAEILRRVEVEGIQVKEFALVAGISPGNAAVRAHRAREALRAQVVRACGTCAEHGCLDCRCPPASPSPS